MNQSATAKQLLENFLTEAKKQAGDVEPIRVLRCNAFRVKDAHVLVRVAADTGKFFFGLNYINAEEVANLDNAYIAFVCGAVDNTVIMPMQFSFNNYRKSVTTEMASTRSSSRRTSIWR
jgi:hypothetical protein